MDGWLPQNDRVGNRQGCHRTDFGQGNVNAIPDNWFYSQTGNGLNPPYLDSSCVAPYPGPAQPYNPGAEQGLRQLYSSGSTYQRSPFTPYPEEGSCDPSNHGPYLNPNAPKRYSYYKHQSSNIGVHTGPAMSGSICFKQTVHGPSQYPQCWTRTPNMLPGNDNYYVPGQPWLQNGRSESQNPQYDRPYSVPSPKTIHGTPRALGPYDLPIGQGTAASLKGHPNVWNERPEKGMDRSRLIPHNYPAELHRPCNKSHRCDTPGVIPTVPILEKSKSTPSRPTSKACRSPHSSKEGQVQDGDRTPKPRGTKPGKQRILTPAGRDHAKAIRQSPGGACANCKRKKTKARGSDDACLHKLPEDMAELKPPSTPFTDIETPDYEPGSDPLFFTPSADGVFDGEDQSLPTPEKSATSAQVEGKRAEYATDDSRLSTFLLSS